MTTIPLKGDVEGIERGLNSTVVICENERITLDEGLISFGTAIENQDFAKAIMLLESLEENAETESMWRSLSALSLKEKNILVAERAFAAIGDFSKARYLHKLNQSIQNNHVDYQVNARLAALNKQFKLAEAIYMEQGKPEEAMTMYQELHRMDLSLKIAEAIYHPDLAVLTQNYYDWLLNSGQEDKAAEYQVEGGKLHDAINLYMKAQMPSKAYQVFLQLPGRLDSDLCNSIAAALSNTGLYEKAGDLHLKCGQKKEAFDSYKKGKLFRQAVELARTIDPAQVIILEEQWGEHLLSLGQAEAAINHFIEAGCVLKAVNCAIDSNQWKKVVGLLDSLSKPERLPIYILLGNQYDKASDFENAEKYYILAEKPEIAVEMYSKNKRFDKAYLLASTFMPKAEVEKLYYEQALQFENCGDYKNAEKIYLTINDPDEAITMYRNLK